MKLIKHMAIVIISVLLLTGCEDTPSEVKEEIENYKHSETLQKTKIVTMPFLEAIERSEKFYEENNTNISMENLIVPNSTKMPTYRVDFYNENVSDLFTKLQFEPLFSNYGNGAVVETNNDLEVWLKKKNYCFTAFPELNGSNYYRNASDVMISEWGFYYGQNMRMTELGCISLYCDEEKTGIGSCRKYPVQKRFYDNFVQEKEMYTLYDGTSKSVADITEFAEDFCNARLKKIENSLFDYQVNYVDVRDLGNNSFGYYVTLKRKDSYGNYFDATRNYFYGLDEFINKNALIASPIHIWITSSDSISEFEINYTFSLEEIAANDSIVSLDSAAAILSNTLAQGKSYVFDTVELKYIFEITQSDYIDAAREYAQTEESKENMFEVVYSPDSVYAYGDYEINAIPYWVFTDVNGRIYDTNCGKIYMVNALDGSFRIENVNEYGNQLIYY